MGTKWLSFGDSQYCTNISIRWGWLYERSWEGYGRDMGGIPDIPPIPKPLSTKAFPKKMGGMEFFP
jgi:hypothetical protein